MWWERDLDPLRARVEHQEHDVAEVVLAAAALARFLEPLPPLAVLDPLPGRARPARAPLPDDVDARLLTRVRQLLAQAESTPFEAEAETFSARAQTLMARHSLDAAMLSATSSPDERDGPTAVRIHIIRPYEGPKTVLITAVAGANRCRTVWSKALGFVTVIGQPPDLVAVESLFTSLLVQADRAMIAEGRRSTSWGQSRTRSFRQSFLMAYATRIGERLQRAAADELAQRTGADRDPRAEASAPHGSTMPVLPGEGLVEVLHERSAEVDAPTAELFPDLVQKAVRHSSDLEGWRAGSRAADQAALFDATAVEPA
ncbi:MAG: DUF2786 domain-containing protein [Actinomycetota bacterium]|nr:DUF2786 domain-containing protein [Actinomycetota bacterium]